MATPTVHASAVLIGVHAVLIKGASGSGKSRLALALLQAADNGTLPFARLVGDDRIHLEAAHGHLLARPASALVGQIEVRGLGIRRVAYDPVAVVGLVVELGVAVERLPAAEQKLIVLSGIHLPRLPVAGGIDPLPVLLAHIRTGRTNP